MNRRNFAATTLALSALILLPGAACNKDKGGAGAAGSAGLMSFMPKDTSAVIGIAPSQAASSELFGSMKDKIMAGSPLEIEKMKTDCGIDLMTDISSVVVSLGADPEDEDSIVIGAKGKFDQKKIEECITKSGGKVEGTVYTNKDGDTMNAHWAAADTIVVSKRSLDVIKAGGLKDNKEVMAMVNKADKGATIWAAGMIPDGGGSGPMGMKTPKSGHMSITLSSGVKAKIGATFASEEDAKGTHTAMKGFMSMGAGQPGMKEIIDSIKTEQSGADITINANISADQIKTIQGMTGM
jgi:hypothetical protein